MSKESEDLNITQAEKHQITRAVLDVYGSIMRRCKAKKADDETISCAGYSLQDFLGSFSYSDEGGLECSEV